jgi:hypothetical protein
MSTMRIRMSSRLSLKRKKILGEKKGKIRFSTLMIFWMTIRTMKMVINQKKFLKIIRLNRKDIRKD